MLKARSFALELYPEDKNHMDTLEYIKSYYDYAYILHDKDIYDFEVVDNDGITIHSPGELKKPHYHVVLNFKNARSIEKLKKELNLKHVETCNFYLYIRYLIHKDNPKKYQYNENEIITNMDLRVLNALKRDYNSQEQDTRLLVDYIRYLKSNKFVTIEDIYDFACDNDCLLDLKKNIHFYNQFLDWRRF